MRKTKFIQKGFKAMMNAKDISVNQTKSKMFLLPWQYLAKTMLGRTSQVLYFHWLKFPEIKEKCTKFRLQTLLGIRIEQTENVNVQFTWCRYFTEVLKPGQLLMFT